MSNIIAFPVNHPGNVAKLGEIDSNLAQERMADVRDRIQDISTWLIAIQGELAKVAANTNLPAEQSWA